MHGLNMANRAQIIELIIRKLNGGNLCFQAIVLTFCELSSG